MLFVELEIAVLPGKTFFTSNNVHALQKTFNRQFAVIITSYYIINQYTPKEV